MTLAEAKRQHVLATLAACSENVSEAARRLAIQRSTLQRMLKRWVASGEGAQPVVEGA